MLGLGELEQCTMPVLSLLRLQSRTLEEPVARTSRTARGEKQTVPQLMAENARLKKQMEAITIRDLQPGPACLSLVTTSSAAVRRGGTKCLLHVGNNSAS